MSVPPPEEMKRKKVGVITHVSKSTHLLIAKAESELSIGDFVYDEHGKRAGSVFDFFGPVASPFIAVKPHGEEPDKLVGGALYLVERTDRRQDRNFSKKRR